MLEKLVQVSPGMEIWWDSSPVIFENWCRKLLAKAQEGDQRDAETSVHADVRRENTRCLALSRCDDQSLPLSCGDQG